MTAKQLEKKLLELEKQGYETISIEQILLWIRTKIYKDMKEKR